MNDRIRELWDKAAESAAAFPSGANNSWQTQVDFVEKFALLIVAECAGIYDKIDNGNQHQGTDDYLLALQRNFGVK